MLKNLLLAPFTASAIYARNAAQRFTIGCLILMSTIVYTLCFCIAFLMLLTFAGTATTIVSLSWILRQMSQSCTNSISKAGGKMFWKKRSTLESVLGVEDRGPVEDFFRSGTWWHTCCARCSHRAHIVWDGKKAQYACPVCLGIISNVKGDDGGSDGKGAKEPDPVKPEVKRPVGDGSGSGAPTGKNRIAKYLDRNGDRPRPGATEQNLSDLPDQAPAWRTVLRVAGGSRQ